MDLRTDRLLLRPFAASDAGEDARLVGNLYVTPEGPPGWRTWTVGYVLMATS